MKLHCVFLFLIAGMIGSPKGFTQRFYDPVYGDIQDFDEENIQGVFAFAYPTIDLIKNDEEATLTLGIPYPFDPGTSVRITVVENPDGIQVYPNPVSDVLHLIREHSDNLLEVSIMNLQGRTLYMERWQEGQSSHQAPVIGLVNGFYLVKFQEPGNPNSLVLKMIKY